MAAILISMLPPDLQHALIKQADKIDDHKSTRDRVATIVEAKLALKNPDAIKCHAVHRSTDHAEAWEDSSEACDVDAVNSKSGLFCYRCGGQGHIAAKCATPAPTKGKGKDVGKGDKQEARAAATRGKAKEGGNGFCSYCGKKGHGPRDRWTKQKDDANNGKTDVEEVEEDIGGFDIGCVDKEKMYPPRLPEW